MRSRFWLALAYAVVFSAHAQDETNLWLRYALRAPIDSNWTWHNEPDFRTRLEPDGGSFNQFLFRSDMQRRLNSVHVLGFGLVGVWSETKGRPPGFEWRPQVTWFVRPARVRDLQFRGRVEWRQQYALDETTRRTETVSTLRCRALLQLEIPLRRDASAMRYGFRNQAELLVRGYNSNSSGTGRLAFYDQSRVSVAFVGRAGKRVEIEGTWLWILRDNSTVQQMFRVAAVHNLLRKAVHG